VNGAVQKVSESAAVVQQRGFDPLHLFAIVSLLAFVAVASLMGYLFRQLAMEGLLRGAESEHVKLAQVMGNSNWGDAFGPWMEMTRGKSADELRVSLELPAIQRKMVLLMKGTRVFKIKAYDLQGRTIFSTDVRQIGEDKSANPGVKAALLGLSSSSLVYRNEVSHFEGQRQIRDLVESYVPHYDPATGKVNGVFEIYGDATGVLADIDQRQWYLVAVVVGPLALLYLALLGMVRRGRRALLRQNLS